MAEWRVVFWVTFVVFVVTTIIYCIWASGEIQPWNTPGESKQFIENGEFNSDISKSVNALDANIGTDDKDNEKENNLTEKKEAIEQFANDLEKKL